MVIFDEPKSYFVKDSLDLSNRVILGLKPCISGVNRVRGENQVWLKQNKW